MEAASKLLSQATIPKSHRDALAIDQQRYNKGLQDGTIVPTVYPAFTYGLALIILFFLIPPTSRLHNVFTRYLTFSVASGWHLWMILNCKAYGPSVSFGIGIISCWGIVWAAVILVFQDAKRDWRRVKREESWEVKDYPEANASIDEKHVNGNTGTVTKRKTKHVTPQEPTIASPKRKIEEQRVSYRWQSYPSEGPFLEKLEWSLDCICNMRGVGWNWKIAGLPSRPSNVQTSLNADEGNHEPVEDRNISRNGIPRCDTYWSVLIHNSWLITKGFIAIDIIKVVNNHDPYFWGYMDAPPPAWLPHLISSTPAAVRMYRQFFSMLTVWVGLRTLYCGAPLLFVGILGPKYIGAMGEPWLYPDHYGSYYNVFTRGLAGWWGGWWHQVFRYAFEASGQWFTQSTLRLNKKSQLAGLISMFVAFFVSGLLHASGSYSMLGDTNPLGGSMTFFLLQPLGIIGEMAWRGILKKTGLYKSIPGWLGGTANFIYVHAWFWLTGPFLTDDFAKGGLWLFEPIAFSPLRGLGFGTEGDGFWCWGGRHSGIHVDRRWWLSGISF